MNEPEKFAAERDAAIPRMAADSNLTSTTRQWFLRSCHHQYSYNFTWLGLPIIQYPQDILALQELIWQIKPDLIIETGVARGGSLVFFASMLQLVGSDGQVLGIDIDIREHNRRAIESHPLSPRIILAQGSSIDKSIVARARALAAGKSRILVILDSNHTHAHVLAELRLYSPLVTRGSYLVVFDTVIEDLPKEHFAERPWGPGNNPKSAVREFLRQNDRFEIDPTIPNKLLITVAPDGYLRCIKD
jgi:cephalosporin hydroxylase